MCRYEQNMPLLACCRLTCVEFMVQMGGPEGVRAAEMTSITLSCMKGMKMHAIARVPS